MKPLEGVKILDFSQFFAGPLCTLLLSDMGAEVIKLENVPIGDPTRYNVAIENDKSTNFTTRNRGKKSVIMNLKDERQKAIFLEMVKTADAVVENFKPGTLQKFGITWELLHEINPKIVYTSISGYGQTGPYREHAAYDTAVQAECGIISITGEDADHTVRPGAAIADATAGFVGCIGTLAALFDARRTGEGRRVDIAMLDAMVTMMENFVSSYLVTGNIPKPLGNRMYTSCPFRDFMCKDGKPVFIGISTDSQFKTFCGIVGHNEWLEDPRFATMNLRAQNYLILEPLVEEALLQIDSDTLCEEMQKYKLVYGHLNNMAQVCEHPQVAARNMLVNAVYADGTTFRVPGCPVKMSGMEPQTDYPAFELGANTLEVLSQYADMSALHEIYDQVLESCTAAARAKYHP